MTRRALCLFVLTLVLPAALAAAAVTTSKVFKLRYLRVGDAALLVQPLLSEEGSLTIEARGSRLTVQDRQEVVDAVARLLGELDVAPARYRVLVELYEATKDAAAGGASAADLKLGDVFRFTSFRRVGAAVLEGEVGGAARADLGAGYLIRFRVEPDALEPIELPSPSAVTVLRPPELPPRARPASEPGGGVRVRLEDLVLVRVVEGRPIEVLRSRAEFSTGQQVVVAASASESARRGLVLVLKAEPPGR